MILLKSVRIIDPTSSFNGSKLDVLIHNGKIKKITKSISESSAKTISIKNLHISPMWIDVGVYHGDPGREHREDRDSLTKAAVKGGYGAIVGMPNTNPVIDDKTMVNYFQERATNEIVDSFVFGAVTKGAKGESLAEMYDMHSNGAVGFTDGSRNISDPDLMLKALKYVKSWNGIIFQTPVSKGGINNGHIHEGETSTRMGIVGMPSVFEKISIDRDLALNNYAESRLHFLHVSSKEGMDAIRKGKQKQSHISVSVPIINLFFEDKDIIDFNVNLKVMPPLREKSDKKALVKAIKDGVVDFVSTNHKGIEEEGKKLEFPYAEFGAIGLETGYAALNTVMSDSISQERIIELLAIKSRELMGIDIPTIEEGRVAKLTLFSPTEEWVYDVKEVESKSRNTPFGGVKFKGKPFGIINGRKHKILL